MLILPGSNEFEETIDVLTLVSANQNSQVLIVRPGNFGLPEVVSIKVAQEYLLDGEFEERLTEINEHRY